MKKRSSFLVFSLLLLLAVVPLQAQTKKPKPAKAKTASSAVLTNDEIALGLKDALSNGVTKAIALLGRRGGYYNNPRVKITMTGALESLENTLRAQKNDDLADDFVVSMNRAAEQSVAETTLVFSDAIKQMAIPDAKNILAGDKDAATQFFRRSSEEKLRAKLRPIMQTSTEELGVNTQFKNLTETAGGFQKDFSIDDYIVQKMLDGLFLLIADEEKRIRENPAARTTAIMQKVFGGVK